MLKSILYKNLNRVRNLCYPGNLILMYHRVNKEGMDPWGLCVTPENFEEHLKVIRDIANPVSLNEITRLNCRTKSIAITFDDGYADNLYYAKKLLEKYSIPATFFISTEQVRIGKEFWWDELEQLLLQPGILPDNLRISIDGNYFNWTLGKAAMYSEDQFKNDLSNRAWTSEAGTRLNLYYLLWQRLFPLKQNIKRSILDSISKWSGILNKVRETHRPLNYNEMLQLGRTKLFEIGAHGQTHLDLTKQASSVQKSEIRESKQFLEKALDRKVTYFAYPHGMYSDATGSFVKSAGFSYAFTTDEGSIRSASTPYFLPRVQVENLNRNAFLKQLRHWIHH